MKKFLLLFFTFLSLGISAQLKVPAASPLSKVEQVVGYTDISIEYSRPSKRDRIIFGKLVPYGEIWRTGANKNTLITFSEDVKIDGKDLKKGSYGIYTKPNKDNWEIIFYSDTNNWGTPEKWDDSKIALKTIVKADRISFTVETFTIMLSDLTFDSANLNFIWDQTKASVAIQLSTKEKVEENLKKAIAGPSAGDYYYMANYSLNSGDYTKAKTYIEKAISLQKEPAYWMHRQQSLIYAKLGDTAGAIKAAKISLEAAEKAKNETYIKLNKASILEWGAK